RLRGRGAAGRVPGRRAGAGARSRPRPGLRPPRHGAQGVLQRAGAGVLAVLRRRVAGLHRGAVVMARGHSGAAIAVAAVSLAGPLLALVALHRGAQLSLERVLDSRLRAAGESAALLLSGRAPDAEVLRALMRA